MYAYVYVRIQDDKGALMPLYCYYYLFWWQNIEAQSNNKLRKHEKTVLQVG